MKKYEQTIINNHVELEIKEYTNEEGMWNLIKDPHEIMYGYHKRLRSSSAYVTIVEDRDKRTYAYLLVSYGTPIALCTGSNTYDFLRKVYGYTATSAKHVRKFHEDYGSGKESDLYRWREI